MLTYPRIPKWWETKFTLDNAGYESFDWILGYDTETFNGHILTQQFFGEKGESIEWVNDDNVLENFLSFLGKLKGRILVFGFYLKFDLALLMRLFINKFLQDDFCVMYRGWKLNVYCSRNWFATLSNHNTVVEIIDVNAFFMGSLEKVSKSFGITAGKMEKPEGLGSKKFTLHDKYFVKYAIRDAKLAYLIGLQIVKFCQRHDVSVPISSAQLAEKIFRRNFMKDGQQLVFSPPDCTRASEMAYHGGKNGYYLEHPALISGCYEYDFNAAYSSAMSALPSFLEGQWSRVNTLKEGRTGIYFTTGVLRLCRYGIFYDRYFNYHRGRGKVKYQGWVTGAELEEAIDSGEYKADYVSGWTWISRTNDNPIKDYVHYFWEKKQKSVKGTVEYMFNKLLLNSLYGKWIQRNPITRDTIVIDKGNVSVEDAKEQAGGLYHPFIAANITGFVRAKLHHYEHKMEAIESSTDAVKSTKLISIPKGFGQMEMQKLHCDTCGQDKKTFTGLFLRNRLNLCMDNREHVLKFALHGFWGSAEELKRLWKERGKSYSVLRIPNVREALKQQGKSLFTMMEQERSVNIEWEKYKEI